MNTLKYNKLSKKCVDEINEIKKLGIKNLSIVGASNIVGSYIFIREDNVMFKNQMAIASVHALNKTNNTEPIIKSHVIPSTYVGELPTLSILVCTMPSRKDVLQKLLDKLKPQLNDRVEVLIESDNGEMILGRKRNVLLDKAKNDYVCFVDDDDLVSDNYVELILDAINSTPDCCSLQGINTINGKNPMVFTQSIKHEKWYAKNINGKTAYFRPPTHLNTIKRELALQIRFNDLISGGEDKDFSNRIQPILKTESEIPVPIYFYLYQTGRKAYK